jgi:hypothetical protein
MLVHLLKLQIDPNSPSVERWFEEVLKFHADAVLTLSPSIKQPLDVDKIWRLAKRGATYKLPKQDVGMPDLPAAAVSGQI